MFTASSAEEGIAILKERQIDIIVTDQRMPGMSGIDFLKESLDLAPRAGRVLLTAHADDVSISDAVNEARIHIFVTKSCKYSDLVNMMKDLEYRRKNSIF